MSDFPAGPSNLKTLDYLDCAAPFYVSGEDNLQLRTFNTQAGVVLSVFGRFLTLEGRVVPFVFTQTPTSDGLLTSTKCPLGEGWILNVTVRATTGTPTGTACICELEIIRGLSGATQALGTIAQGAVTSTQDVTWPLTLASSGSAASSTIRSILGTVPAAGAEISETVTAGKRWRLMAVRFTFVTSATVANREPRLTVDDGAGNIAFLEPSTVVMAASSTQQYSWGHAAGVIAASSDQNRGFPFPAVTLPAAARIRTNTSSIQVGDQYSAPVYLIEESAA